MLIQHRRLVLILMLLSAVPVFTQTNPLVLTVTDAVQHAMKNNVGIQRGQVSFDRLKWARNFSWGGVSPSVNLVGQVSVPNEKPALTPYDYSVSLGGSIELALTPSLYTTIRAAALAYRGGELSYDQAVRTVELSVRRAFYGLLYAQENIRLQERNLETARQQYEQTNARYQNGQVSEIDMLQSRVAYERQRPTLQSAVIAYENSLASFKQLIGLEQQQAIVLSGSLSEAAQFADFSLDYDINDTPAVVSLENEVAVAKNAVLAGRLGAYGPTISAGWSYTKSKVNTADSFSTGGQLTIGVRIPLDGYLPWSTGGRAVLNAKYSLKDAELQLANQKTTTMVQIDNYYALIQEARSQLESLRATIDLADRSYTAMRTAYNQGARDVLSLQNAADTLLSAQVNLASQEYALIGAVLNLENELGIPFGTLGK